jgi:hypothetical protein
MDTIELINVLFENNGFTYNCKTKELNPNEGYFVSMVGEGKIYNASTFNHFDILEYYAIHGELLSRGDTFLGGWIHQDEVYLDVNVATLSIEKAIYRGMINDQKVIYNAYNKTEINLPIRQKSGTETQQKAYNIMKSQQLAFLIETTGVQ